MFKYNKLNFIFFRLQHFSGIPMYIIPDNVIYDPLKLLEFLKKNQITRMLFTPSLIQAVLDAKLESTPECFASMK